MSATIDLKTIKLAIDKRTGDYRRNTTGKIEYTFIERPSGRKRYGSTDCESVEDAQTFLRGLKGDLHEHQSKRDEATIAEAADLYVKDKNGQTSYKFHIMPVLRAFGDRRFSSLTAPELIEYKAERRKTNSEGSIRNEIGALKTIRAWAIANGLIPREKVALLVDIKRPAEEKVSKRGALSDAECDRLWTILTTYVPYSTDPKRLSRVARAGAIAIDTGARREAIETLKWAQVDFENKLIHFDEHLDRPMPKNKKRGKAPMSVRLEALLRRAEAEKTGPWVLDIPGEVDETFKTAIRGTEFAKDARLAAGKFEVTFHIFRHSFITNAIKRGNNIVFVAKIVGDTVQMLMDRYAHLQPGFVRDQVIWADSQRAAVRLVAAE
jgi:integrase